MEQDKREAAVERWGDMVWRLALARMANVADAEDVFQEVFLRYFRHEDKMESDEHRRAWLIRCTLNRAKSALASPGGSVYCPLKWPKKSACGRKTAPVYAAVLALPPKYRTVVHLHYFEGLSVAEIAAVLGCAEGTVKSQLYRAREQLRETLRDAEL